MKTQINDEDTDWMDITNKKVFAQRVARTEVQFDFEKVGTKPKKLDAAGATRKKENKGDVVTRVLDRKAVKALAESTVKPLQNHKKG